MGQENFICNQQIIQRDISFPALLLKGGCHHFISHSTISHRPAHHFCQASHGSVPPCSHAIHRVPRSTLPRNVPTRTHGISPHSPLSPQSPNQAVAYQTPASGRWQLSRILHAFSPNGDWLREGPISLPWSRLTLRRLTSAILPRLMLPREDCRVKRAHLVMEVRMIIMSRRRSIRT